MLDNKISSIKRGAIVAGLSVASALSAYGQETATTNLNLVSREVQVGGQKLYVIPFKGIHDAHGISYEYRNHPPMADHVQGDKFTNLIDRVYGNRSWRAAFLLSNAKDLEEFVDPKTGKIKEGLEPCVKTYLAIRNCDEQIIVFPITDAELGLDMNAQPMTVMRWKKAVDLSGMKISAGLGNGYDQNGNWILDLEELASLNKDIDADGDGHGSERELYTFVAGRQFQMSQRDIEKLMRSQFVSGLDYQPMALSPLQNGERKISMGPGSVDEMLGLGIKVAYLAAFQKSKFGDNEQEAMRAVEGAELIQDRYKIGWSIIREGHRYNVIIDDKRELAKTDAMMRNLETLRRTAERYDVAKGAEPKDGFLDAAEAKAMLKDIDGANGSTPDGKIDIEEIAASLLR